MQEVHAGRYGRLSHRQPKHLVHFQTSASEHLFPTPKNNSDFAWSSNSLSFPFWLIWITELDHLAAYKPCCSLSPASNSIFTTFYDRFLNIAKLAAIRSCGRNPFVEIDAKYQDCISYFRRHIQSPATEAINHMCIWTKLPPAHPFICPMKSLSQFSRVSFPKISTLQKRKKRRCLARTRFLSESLKKSLLSSHVLNGHQ